jgi:hypothetical protein
VSDQLYLSLWIPGFAPDSMLRHFGKLLRTFPFSRLRPGLSSLRVYALEFVEPPLFEGSFPEGAEVETVLQTAREFENPDCAYVVEGLWELWRLEGEWKLKPAPVSLHCYGPEFENDLDDQFRVELGPDTAFLPQPEIPGSAIAIQSNLRGLLRLAQDVTTALPLRKRQLWLESGEDFSARLAKSRL